MDKMIDAIFSVDFTGMWIPTLSILEKIIRPIIVYAFLIIILRINGKRELVQINTFDFIVLLMLSNVIQNAIIGNDNSITGGIIGAISLLAINYFVAKVLYKHNRIEETLEGHSDYLIVKGNINTTKLEKELISIKDLEMAAHKQGVNNIKDIETAEIDPDGEIFIIPKNISSEAKIQKEILYRLGKIEKNLKELQRNKEV